MRHGADAGLLDDEAVARLVQASASRREFVDVLEPELRLRVGPRGARWSLLRRRDGRRVRVALGEWPTLDVEGARELARERRRGPTAVTLGERTARLTVAELLTLYAAKKLRNFQKPRSTYSSLCRLFAGLMDSDVRTLTSHDIAAAMNVHGETAPAHANRMRSYAAAVFSWAIQEGLMTGNPAAGVTKRFREGATPYPAELLRSIDARMHPVKGRR